MHITWDSEGRRLVDGKLAPEHCESVTDIYVVTVGEYSEIMLEAAFTSEAEANEYAAEMNRRKDDWESTYNVQRVDLNPPLPAVVEKITQPKPIHITKVVEDKIADGRQFYRVHCSCNFISGPLWSEASAEKYATTHSKGSVW